MILPILLLAFANPAMPLTAPGTSGTQRVVLLVQPDLMEICKQRLHSGKLPLGCWTGTIKNYTDHQVTVFSQDIRMAVPEVDFLSKEKALPILLDHAGGWWKQVAHYAMIAGALAPGGIGAAQKISVHALKIIGGIMAGIEITRKDLEGKTPDLSALTIEVPASITIPAGGGASFDFWAAKMRNAHSYKVELEIH